MQHQDDEARGGRKHHFLSRGAFITYLHHHHQQAPKGDQTGHTHKTSPTGENTIRQEDNGHSIYYFKYQNV
jgi:hypothetical protein